MSDLVFSQLSEALNTMKAAEGSRRFGIRRVQSWLAGFSKGS